MASFHFFAQSVVPAHAICRNKTLPIINTPAHCVITVKIIAFILGTRLISLGPLPTNYRFNVTTQWKFW